MEIELPTKNALVVARKDFRDAMRSRLIIALGVLFVVGESLAGIVEVEIIGKVLFGSAPAAPELTRSIASHAVLFIAFVTILVAYRSIAGERASGSIKFLLSTPNTRMDVLVGKVLGRWSVIALPLTVGYTVGTAVGWIWIGETALSAYLIGLFGITVFALTYVCIVVALSASMRSTTRIVAAAMALFVVFHFAWEYIPASAYITIEFLLKGDEASASSLISTTWPAWTVVFDALSPARALDMTLNLMTDEPLSPPLPLFMNFFISLFGGLIGSPEVEDVWYATNWLGPISLILWSGLSLIAGYLRFDAADL
ncbi:ABC transporter permease [Halococcoides cellulosivorans]|uniref:ABC transporter permease n=1 Tax=Halococcoides cellulosivorans TaxID=1679096 RepID=A0A2R4WZQ3_9EURY|nr:ABC transporter permease subunit [Halococcoides cellulosivorans]AWB27033.1 hypothetical protein HARCEL1_04580 [Halococcoides cellulosivorans]